MPMLTRRPGWGYQRVLSTNPAAPSFPAKTTVLACLWLRDAWCWLVDASASVRGALT